jgi:hypothetical protein
MALGTRLEPIVCLYSRTHLLMLAGVYPKILANCCLLAVPDKYAFTARVRISSLAIFMPEVEAFYIKSQY